MGAHCCLPSKTYHEDPVIAGRFQVSDRIIGTGSFAVVKLGLDRETQKKVAIRSIRRSNCTLPLAYLRQELEVHRQLKHPAIAECLFAAWTTSSITMVVEYVPDGSLLDYVGRLHDENRIRDIFKQLLSAIHYLHSNGIVHRDIKLENILVKAASWKIKLVDFTFAAHFDEQTLFQDTPGTLVTAPPEVLLGRPYKGPPRDIWASGVVLYCLWKESYPFKDRSEVILKEIPAFEAPEGVKDLVSKMLVKDPDDRAALSDLRRHAWLQNSHDMMVVPELIVSSPSL